MKLALDLLTSFVGPSHQNESDGKQAPEEAVVAEKIFSVTAHVETLKFVISDPVMGMHRPFLSICVPSLQLTASQFKQVKQAPLTKLDKLTGRGTIDNAKDLQASMEVCQ